MIHLNPKSETLALQLAAAQSLSVEDAIEQALEERARASGLVLKAQRLRDASPEAIAAREARFDAITQKFASMHINDPRSTREIMDDLNTL